MPNYYNSSNIVIFPSSNAVDNGKVTSEQNIRDIITRLKVKNYKMNPSQFTLSADSNGNIKITAGVACINGYRIETTGTYTTTEKPSSNGDYYIVMSLNKISDKVAGDVNSLCNGVSINFVNTSSTVSDDQLVLGTGTYSSSKFSNVVTDTSNLYPFSSDSVVLDELSSSTPSNSITYAIKHIDDKYVIKSGDDYKSGSLVFRATDSGSDVISIAPSSKNIKIMNSSSVYSLLEYNDIRFYSSSSAYSRISGTGSKISASIGSTEYISADSSNGISINGNSKPVSIKTNGNLSISNNSYSLNVETGSINAKVGSTTALSIKNNEYILGNIKLTPSTNTLTTTDGKIINVSQGVSGSSLSLSGALSVGGNASVTGTLTASKVYNAVYNGFGEIFRRDINENIEYGDVVCIRRDGLVHKVSSDSDLESIVGICSNTIGFELGGCDIPEDERVEVELVGQIWVKTDETDIVPGNVLSATADGKVKVKLFSEPKFAIALTNVINGKVKVLYHGI